VGETRFRVFLKAIIVLGFGSAFEVTAATLHQEKRIEMKRLTYLLLVAIFLLSLGSGNAYAQATASGTIQGTVTDKSGAVVSGAQVIAKSKATDTTRTVTSDGNGDYRFQLLPIGVYTVTIAKAGFATVAETIEILIGQVTTVNAELKPGAASEIIEVTSDAPLVDQLKTSVSQNITPSEVEELPLLGRDVANLAYLAPGVKATDSYDPTKNRYAILSVNGQGGRNVNVTINGVDNKDNTVGGPVMQLPLEAVQEFVISTQRFSAANGRSEGAAINMITKAGTNRYHGSLFGFFREQQFNAENVDEQAAGVKGPYSRQFFGGSVGGPIVKDKLFGFFAFERQREHSSKTESPDAFSELTLAAGAGLAAQPTTTISTPFFENRYNARFDYKFNDRETAYFSYTSQANDSLNDQAGTLGDLTEGNFTKNHLQAGNVTLNSVLSNSLVNSFLVGYQYWNNIIDSKDKVPFVTFTGGSSFGTNVNVPQESYQRKWQFRDDITKTFGRHTFGAGVDFIYNPKLGGFFESNSTVEVDFGADPSVILANPSTCGPKPNNNQPCYPQGFATPGAVISMSGSAGNPYFDMPGGTKQLGLYFQDDWKVTKRLTVNLGIRWDKDYNLIGASAIAGSRTFQELTAIGSPYAKLPHDDNKDFSPRVGFAYDLTGKGKHILRGGYGLYYGNVFQNIPLFMIQQANPTIYQGLFSLTADGPLTSCNPADCTVPGTNIPLSSWRYGVDPFPTLPPPLGDLVDGATGRLMDPKYRNPVSQQINFGYQWAVTNSSVIEVEYVHELGLHENKTININPTIASGIATDPITGKKSVIAARPLAADFADAGVPVLGRVMDEESINRSRYDGLNLSYRQRMTKRFSLNANYTLSRAMGWGVESGGADAGSGFRNYPHDPLNPWDPRDFGPTPNDERHHITMSAIAQLPWGLQVAPIITYGSARPFDLRSTTDILVRGSGYSRPVLVPNDDPTNFLAIGDAVTAFECLSAATCHQVGYDTMRGNYYFETDLRVAKNIRVGEGKNLQLIFQAFNLTNKSNTGSNIHNTAGATNFLERAGFINPNSTFIPRAFTGEFGARFTF
jgi:outer membrane receptor protein involved in Fe transport